MKHLLILVVLALFMSCAKEETKISCEMVKVNQIHLCDEYNVFIYEVHHGNKTAEEFTEFMTYYHDQEKLFIEQLKNCE